MLIRRLVAMTLAGAGSGLLTLASPATMAQAGGDVGMLEEISVTARRITESLQDAPLAVTAIGEKAISDFRLQDMKDFASLAPNTFVPSDAFHQNTQISIRGGRYVDPQVEPDFGLYRNGQYYGGPRTNLASLVDVERVEVLRGPQVALYGRNSMNGAVNIVFATPTDKQSGYVSAEAARYGRTDLQGWINLPVSDQFAVRAAGWWVHQTDGEHYNPVLDQKLDQSRDAGGRLSARWTPTTDVSVLWMVESGQSKGPDSTEFVETPRCCGLFGPFAFGAVTLPAETKSTILRNTPSEADAKTLYVSQDIDWTTSIGTLGVYANYRKYDRDAMRDFDETPFAPTDFPLAYQQVNTNVDEVRDVNLEARLTSPREQRFRWMIGASYLDESMQVNRRFATSLDLDQLGFFGIPFGFGVNTATGADDIGIDTKSWSAYAELTYSATSQLDLIAGGRYTHDSKDLDFSQYIITDPDKPGSGILAYLFCNPGGCTFPSYALKDSDTFTNFSPMVELSFKFNDDVNGYALVSRGFRAGSYNTTSTNPAFLPYGSEKGTNYEIGLKTMLADRKVRLNLAAFLFDIDDVLLRVLDPVNPGQFSFLQNSGKARTKGIEGELAWRPVKGLDLAMTLGWLDAEIREGASSDQNFSTTPGPGVICSGDPPICKTVIDGSPMPGTRKWTGALLGNYTVPVADSLNWFLNAAYRYQEGGYYSPIPTYPPEGYVADRLDTFRFFDLSTGLESDHWRVIAFMNNLADYQPIVTKRVDQIDRAQGLTYGVRLSARF